MTWTTLQIFLLSIKSDNADADTVSGWLCKAAIPNGTWDPTQRRNAATTSAPFQLRE